MARKLDIETARFEGLKVDPRDLVVDQEQNGRAFEHKAGDVRDILEELRSGQPIRQPVSVRPAKSSDGKATATLISGYRRWLASKIYVEEVEKAGAPEDWSPAILPCLFYSPKDDLEVLILNIRENVVRKDLNIIDLGHDAYRLQTKGKTMEEISDILEVSPAQVSQVIKLVTILTEREQLLVAKNQMTADAAFAIVKTREQEAKGTVPAGTAEKIVQEQLDAANSTSTSTNTEADSSSTSSGTGAEQPRTNPAPRISAEGVRRAASNAGANVGSKRMPELKKYLQQALDEDGPGSNKGEVALKGALLDFIAGELTERQMDNRFQVNCKVKV